MIRPHAVAAVAILALLACSSEAEKKKRSDRRQLETLPYMGSAPVAEQKQAKNGITLHERGAAHDGLNLFKLSPPDGAPLDQAAGEAVLMNMEGVEVHRWSTREAQPTGLDPVVANCRPGLVGWHHVEIGPDDHLFAVISSQALLKLRADSSVVWKADVPAHHDISFTPDGKVYTIGDAPRFIDRKGVKVPILDQELVRVSAAGKIEDRISMYDTFRSDPRLARLLERELAKIPDKSIEDLIREEADDAGKRCVKSGRAAKEHESRIADAAYQRLSRLIGGDGVIRDGDSTFFFSLHQSDIDLFHTNTVDVIGEDLPGLWKKGDLVFSTRDQSVIGVLDARTHKVLWSWGENDLSGQHQPVVLPGGNVLVFDNGLYRKKEDPLFEHSRTVEVDPHDNKIVWSFVGPPKYYSPGLAGAQRLGNGNTLIVEGTEGHAFEVTPAGKLVWEYYVPVRGKDRPFLYRMERLDPARLARIKDAK